MSEPPAPGQPQNHVGDPRLTEADRAILRRITTGDLADEFASALANDLASDPLLGGSNRVGD
jgi:hypothetical protein